MPLPSPCRVRRLAECQAAAVRGAKIRTSRRKLRAPTDSAQPDPPRNPPWEPDAAVRLEYAWPLANRARDALRRAPLARTNAHFPATPQGSRQESKASVRDPP